MPAVIPSSHALPRLRSVVPTRLHRARSGLLLLASIATACATTQPAKEPPPTTELELAYDSGPASERPLLPPAQFEWLIKFDPGLAAYQPQRLRLLVAQPGALRLALYSADEHGRPGATLRTLDRVYAPEQTSNGHDGKWLLEPLFDLPKQTAPLFVGLSVPSPGPSAARLWATPSDGTGPAHVFARDVEPGTALQSTRLPLTPMLRLALVPVAAPPPALDAPPAAKVDAPSPSLAPAASPSALPPSAAPATAPTPSTGGPPAAAQP